MQARDLLKEMEKMEESGMERPWVRAVADTIVKAIEPLATRSDLEELRREVKAVDENLRKDMNAGFELVREQMKSLESGLKVWMLASQIILFGGLIATSVLL